MIKLSAIKIIDFNDELCLLSKKHRSEFPVLFHLDCLIVNIWSNKFKQGRLLRNYFHQ